MPTYPDVAALWEWHDGANPGGPATLEIVPQFEFLSADGASGYWDRWRDIKLESPHSPWRPDWLAIGTDGCGGLLIVDRDLQTFLAAPETGDFVHEVATSPEDMVQQLLATLKNDSPFDGFVAIYQNELLTWQEIDANSFPAYDTRYPA